VVQPAAFEHDRELGEQAAMRRVVEQLVSQFPDVPREDVIQAVDAKYHEYDGSPIRDFVPILVERSVREGLTKRSRNGQGA
jgi:hypothetical protein